MSKIWTDERDWAEYVSSSLRFGIWQRCNRVTQICSDTDNIGKSGLRLARELDAIRFLGQELRILAHKNCPIFGQDRYEQSWSDMRQAIRSLKAIDHSSIIIGRYLAAETACFDQIDPLVESIKLRICEQVSLQHNDRDADTAIHVFCQQTATLIKTLARCDRHIVGEKLKGLRAWTWRDLPEQMIEEWKELAHPCFERRRSLSEMFAGAETEDELEAVIRDHAAQAPRTIFAMYHAALYYVIKQPGFDPESQETVTVIAPLVKSLIALHDNFTKDLQEAQASLAKDFARGAAAPAIGGSYVHEFLSQGGANEKIGAWLEDEKQSDLERLEVTLGTELQRYFDAEA